MLRGWICHCTFTVNIICSALSGCISLCVCLGLYVCLHVSLYVCAHLSPSLSLSLSLSLSVCCKCILRSRYTGGDEDLRESFLEICSGLPMTATDYQNCDELIDQCSEQEILYDMLKVAPRKGDALLFTPVRPWQH
eukprot:COSAG03_NODE_12494_length_544_cov_1.591011_2_plen_135_part_01